MEDIEIRYKEELGKIEKIYKNQIEDLIMKNYQTMHQKDQEIAELHQVAKEMDQEMATPILAVIPIQRNQPEIHLHPKDLLFPPQPIHLNLTFQCIL